MRKCLLRLATPKVRKGLELGKGFPKLDPLPPLEDALPSTGSPPTMLHHIVQMMKKYPDAIVLTQVGSFYELYLEQAIEWGPKLNLRVARKKQQSPVAHLPFVNMAGFPVQHRDRYVKSLVQNHGKSVVILDQVASQVQRGGSEEGAKRPVARIITPGTLLAESFVDAAQNNYLVAVSFAPQLEDDVVLAWVDVGVGSVWYQASTRSALANDLARIGPAEVLVDAHWRSQPEIIKDLLNTGSPVVYFKFPPGRESLEYFADRFIGNGTGKANEYIRYSLDSLTERTQKVCAALLAYIDETLPGSQIRFETPTEYNSGEVMQLDPQTRDALEMVATRQKTTAKGSLLSVLRRTVTAAGSRLLHQWLTAPLQDIALIQLRQNRVASFVTVHPLDLRQLVRDLPDGRRLLQKLCMRRVDPLDLVTWAQSVLTLENIRKSHLKAPLFDEWRRILDTHLPTVLPTAEKILKSIDVSSILATVAAEENANARTEAMPDTSLPGKINEYVPVLHPHLSKRLKTLYANQAKYTERRESILERLKEKYGPTVSLRWSPVHHYHVHLRIDTGTEIDPTLVLTRHKKTACISDSEWSSVGVERDQFSADVQREEQRILEKLRTLVVGSHLEPMRECYSVGDEIDVHMSLAELAREKGLVRPQMVEEPILDIRGGRHITVETGLDASGYQDFSPNDCILTPSEPVCMITGPNMGGKSTYIRQGALIALLAHIGSFVPATSATVGIVDRIFCRIGAGDDLYRGRSTFMMEMLETAQILEHATPHSLAVLDEVGRGTSVRDGLAIATATIKHLALRTRCRTLFATHYGREVWDTLVQYGQGCEAAVKCMQAAVHVHDDHVYFDYKLRPGISTDSHGLLVARMASFPTATLEDARNIVEHLKTAEIY